MTVLYQFRIAVEYAIGFNLNATQGAFLVENKVYRIIVSKLANFFFFHLKNNIQLKVLGLTIYCVFINLLRWTKYV